MKSKKYNYILVFILMLLMGINGVYAAEKKVEECFYQSTSNIAKAQLQITSGYDTPRWHAGKQFSKVIVEKLGEKIDNDKETILNWYSEKKDNKTGITFSPMYNGSVEANINPSCPRYLLIRTNLKYTNYQVYSTNDLGVAENFVNKSNNTGKFKTWYLTYTNSNGQKVTKEEYYSGFATVEGIVDFEGKIDCETLFGDKNDPTSIAYVVDLVLGYVRVLIPILIIILGIIDLAKATLASKEDEMRKAQKTFVTRVILGIVVFFVPLIVDIVRELAEIAWDGMGYTMCQFK